jgi:hypothetical protein
LAHRESREKLPFRGWDFNDESKPGQVFLRLGHPGSAPIKEVLVNGKSGKEIDGKKEIIRREGLEKKDKVRNEWGSRLAPG